ncbi:MAG: DHH family phosphoesterase [Planctomycetes bacterium]|nr:DHH family phosphoesterase [Planctomycetota bacterium]
MTPETILDFLRPRTGQRLALVTHVRPDGDALGSVLGLARILNRVGYSADAVVHGPIAPYLGFLVPPGAPIREASPDWWRRYDCLGVLDCGDASRLDESIRPAVDALPAFTIDHHPTSAGIGAAVWIDPSASSVGEMVVRLAMAGHLPIDADAAQALWTAIVTDTGRFSYENTTAAALTAALACVEAGASPPEAATYLYQSVSWAERQLQRTVLNNMELRHDGRLATSWLTRRDFAEAGSGPEDAQNLVNVLRDTSGVEAAVFFYEPVATDESIPSVVKASLRTRAPLDALDVAVQFGGGGHARAAGCSIAAPMAEARRRGLGARAAADVPGDRTRIATRPA